VERPPTVLSAAFAALDPDSSPSAGSKTYLLPAAQQTALFDVGVVVFDWHMNPPLALMYSGHFLLLTHEPESSLVPTSSGKLAVSTVDIRQTSLIVPS
jgi:hypothetical protein